MIITRRGLVAGAAALLLPVVARAGEEVVIPSYDEVLNGKFYGDYGYRHKEYHLQYQSVFGVKLNCACGSGDCRVTLWRRSKLESPIGIDVIIERRWQPLTRAVAFPKPEDIPPELTRDWAHVCAYEFKDKGKITYTIPCAIINEKQG